MNQSSMVRHECAEALGSIATDDAMRVVETFKQDAERVVRESCEVSGAGGAAVRGGGG